MRKAWALLLIYTVWDLATSFQCPAGETLREKPEAVTAVVGLAVSGS